MKRLLPSFLGKKIISKMLTFFVWFKLMTKYATMTLQIHISISKESALLLVFILNQTLSMEQWWTEHCSTYCFNTLHVTDWNLFGALLACKTRVTTTTTIGGSSSFTAQKIPGVLAADGPVAPSRIVHDVGLLLALYDF